MSIAAAKKADKKFVDYQSKRIDEADTEAIFKKTGDFLTSASMFGELSTSSVTDSDWMESPSHRPAFLGNLGDDLVNVIRYAAPKEIDERPEVFIVAVQEWEGFVDKIFDDYFTALMYDVTNEQKRPSEYMEIPCVLVSQEDKALLIEGNIFRLVIGRERRKGGQLQNKTLVYFRKMRFTPPVDHDVSFADLLAEWD